MLIPKNDRGEFRGIGLLESIHKIVSQIINLRMAKSITFSEEVHGFRAKRGTNTAIGETKVRMQMVSMSSETTYQIYLDLRKAYDSIDRGRVLQIMKKYKVGKNLRRYMKNVWNSQYFILRQGGFYSDPLEVNRGCTQGDTDSPIIFNLIIDAVLRTWRKEDWRGSRACFYADDGLIEHGDHRKLQTDIDKMINLFERVGLKTNEIKTKCMVLRGPPAPKPLSREVYDRARRRRKRIGGEKKIGTNARSVGFVERRC